MARTQPVEPIDDVAPEWDASLPGTDRPSDWGSLVADLSRGRDAPELRVHDRTHLEIAVDYRLPEPTATARTRKAAYVWEAYFFAPDSLRLSTRAYQKSDLYTDLQSYVRFEVPDVPFHELVGAPLDRLREALEAGDERAAMRELRLFACEVRAAGVEARHRVAELLRGGDHARSRALAMTARLVADGSRLTARLREALAIADGLPDPLATAARWVDEDVSRILETLLASLVLALRKADAPETLLASVEQAAVAEARYRIERGYPGEAQRRMPTRKVEELEFRRHVLKRFTSSVLWLSPEVKPASTWVLQLFYALAAGVAMAFAVVAALFYGTDPRAGNLIGWALAVVLAYAAKDRLKAMLQTLFNDVVARHFPDRRWRIWDRERGVVLGEQDEQAGFVAWSEVPPKVIERRLLTRVHPLEAAARPETVLFHSKEVRIDAEQVTRADPRFRALTEIFRLDVRSWLAHTDDPKRDFVFADPTTGEICRASAPRVYNIAIVYRLRRADAPDTPWHRARAVVSRKGIRRIDHIC
ncbi:MAG: hypothetical protein KF729_34950 [Sandaracinaceae bacterium]|nr:hypothetical protein [Sandaracinaceae bacterium]